MNKCIICNSINSSFIFEKKGYSFFKCDNCSLIYIYPQSNQEELTKYYSTNKVASKKKRFMEVLNKLDKRGNLLDVGCSNGEFMRLAKERGFTTYGVEVNKRMVGYNIFNGTLAEAKFEDNFFSVIFLGDIIEHVPDPVALLKECKRVLKKDGIMIISTPNYDCFWCRATQWLHKWFKLSLSIAIPPYHLYLFSKNNMSILLDNMGFKISDIKYHKCSLRHELGNTSLIAIPFYLFIYFVDLFFKNYNMTIFVQNHGNNN